MKLRSALLLFAAVTSAYGYMCYTCDLLNPRRCNIKTDCKEFFNLTFQNFNLTELLSLPGVPGFSGSLDLVDMSFRCFTFKHSGLTMKGCMPKAGCVSPIHCCDGELCNAAPQNQTPGLRLGLIAFIILYLTQI